MTCSTASAPCADSSLGEALLAPTRLYVRAVLAALRYGGLHAAAHITGGGLTENLPRVLPEGLGASVDLSTITPPAVFAWLAEAGGIAEAEMLRTFNCGVGMVLVVAPDAVDGVMVALRAEGEDPVVLGALSEGEGVTFTGALF